MKKFLTYTLVALLAGLGVRIIFGAPILLTFLFLEVIYGLYFITQQLSRGWKIIVIAVAAIFILIQGLVWLKGNIEQNFPLTGVFSKPYIKLWYDVNSAASLTPSMIKAKQLLFQKQVDYEDQLAYRVNQQFKDGNPYEAIKLIEAGEKQGKKVRETIIMKERVPPKEKTVFTEPPVRIYGPGCYTFKLNSDHESNWIKIPPEMYWELSTNKEGDFCLIPFDGKVFTFSKAKKEYVDFPDQNILFKINAKEDLVFTLVVSSKN